MNGLNDLDNGSDSDQDQLDDYLQFEFDKTNNGDEEFEYDGSQLTATNTTANTKDSSNVSYAIDKASNDHDPSFGGLNVTKCVHYILDLLKLIISISKCWTLRIEFFVSYRDDIVAYEAVLDGLIVSSQFKEYSRSKGVTSMRKIKIWYLILESATGMDIVTEYLGTLVCFVQFVMVNISWQVLYFVLYFCT